MDLIRVASNVSRTAALAPKGTYPPGMNRWSAADTSQAQQPSSRPPHAQQSRTTHHNPPVFPHEPQKPHTSALEAVRPRSQIEAMPPSPFGAAQKQSLFQPPRGFYDAAAVNHLHVAIQVRTSSTRHIQHCAHDIFSLPQPLSRNQYATKQPYPGSFWAVSATMPAAIHPSHSLLPMNTRYIRQAHTSELAFNRRLCSPYFVHLRQNSALTAMSLY